MKYNNFKEMLKELNEQTKNSLKEGQFFDNSFDLWLNEQHKKENRKINKDK